MLTPNAPFFFFRRKGNPSYRKDKEAHVESEDSEVEASPMAHPSISSSSDQSLDSTMSVVSDGGEESNPLVRQCSKTISERDAAQNVKYVS